MIFAKPRLFLVFTLVLLLLSTGCEPSDPAVASRNGAGVTQNSDPTRSQTDAALPAETGYMPDFALTSLDGEAFNTADQQGRVLLINFWATWCAPCRVEIPDLIALQEELGSEEFDVLGISVDQDDPQYVKDYVESMNINYPVLIDDGEVADGFGGVYALPTTFVIDKTGKITHKTIGIFPVEKARAELVKMIASE